MKQVKIQDKEIFYDILFSEKSMTDHYNRFTNECVTPNVRDSFLGLLNETHMMEFMVFDEVKKRGWDQTTAAEQFSIEEARQKFK